MRKRSTKKASIGSAFDDFLKDEGTYERTQAVAIKRVLAWQIDKAMKDQRLTKAEMARRMDTSTRRTLSAAGSSSSSFRKMRKLRGFSLKTARRQACTGTASTTVW
ncbi:MAG: hypothetical protein HY294_11100 [Candidatus Rokubacteria bacterium]|nr:hypothetical protein [Candidatus Rokubacteria bacterium]MBI3826533.1 hypothetical protein [Candidatus Rokubacteria bacterium]